MKKEYVTFRIYAALFLTVFLVTVIQNVRAKDLQNNDIFAELKNLDREAFRESVVRLQDSLSRLSDVNNRRYYLNQLFDITAQKDEIAHIRLLVWKATASDSAYASFFNEAYRLAEKYNRIDDMCLVEYTRGRFYIARKQYDIAMMHILQYRDLTPESDKGEGYRNIINMLGDIYYYAGLNKKAQEIYEGLYQMYIEEDTWDFYRPYVMMNNLGQIALRTGNPDAALNWFKKSLATAEAHLHTSYRNNTMAYTKIKMAETLLKTNNRGNAEKLLEEVAASPQETIQEDVRQEYLYVKAQLVLMQQKFDEAQKLAELLTPGDTLRFASYRFIPEVYKLQAEINYQKGNYQKALEYTELYNEISDSTKDQENGARSMIILADKNHEKTRLELQKTRHRMFNLLLGGLFLCIVFLVILFYNRKLYRSKLELMKNSIKKASEVESSKKMALYNCKDSKHQENFIREKQLIKDLKELMDKEKLFLDPKINIQQLAEKLSSNRTYLSQAINNQLNSNFPHFINEYRIIEAIKLITSGYTANHTQDALAKQSGFANRTVFISAFKKYTGVLPSFFIANYKKENAKNMTLGKSEVE